MEVACRSAAFACDQLSSGASMASRVWRGSLQLVVLDVGRGGRGVSRFGLLVLVALAVGVGALVAGSAGARDLSKSLPPPKLLSLRYGRFRPQGAPHSYIALRLRVRVRGGQVVETDFHELPSGFKADGLSRCGIGGRKNGGVETFFMPVDSSSRLGRGVHRIRVAVRASSCKRNGAHASSSRTFKVRVSQPR
jgi:hypothetical protein